MISIKRIDIEVFLLAVLCVCFLCPFVQRSLGTVGTLLIIASYLSLEVDRFLQVDDYERDTLFLIGLYIGLLLLYSFLKFSDEGGGQTNVVLFFFTFIPIVPIYRYLEQKHCVFIIRVCILTVFFTLAQNYALWVRMGHRFTQQWYRISGILEVINTQYVTAIMLFSGVLFCMFLYKKGTKIRYFYLIMTALCFAFNCLVTQRLITVLLSLVMFFLLILANENGMKRKEYYFLFLAFLSLFMLLEYDVVLNIIADLINSERIRVRLNSISTLLRTMDLSMVARGSLTERLYLMGISVDTIFSSGTEFLFGVGDKANNLIVGNHSFFIDEFAKFGIFGGILSCTVVLRMLNTAKEISSVVNRDSLYTLLCVLFLVMILRSFVGQILSPPIGVIMFIFAPLVFRMMKYDSAWDGKV